jgi:glycogen debranching enzyme
MKKWFFFLWVTLLLIGCGTEEQTGSAFIPEGSPAFFVTDIPQPYFAEHQKFSELYWAAWNLLYQNVSSGTPQNGFVPRYLDEGFNELIYQWDTCFMAMFAMYGGGQIPAMESLDNFYRLQRSDGWICRVYRESDGSAVQEPSREEPMINPPLFAWVEWKYYLLSGDSSRFGKVLTALDAYYDWIDKNCRGVSENAPLYYNTLLGSGMDNSPRYGIERGGWIDLTSQMGLFSKYMLMMAREVKNESLTRKYQQNYQTITRLINSTMWDESKQFYGDIDQDGRKQTVKTAAAFWTLAAEVASFPQARELVKHLQDTSTFYRGHLFPTLAADHPEYSPQGHYWKGGVWAPVNYMIIKGLEMYPFKELATIAALNHLENMYEVYMNFSPDEKLIAPEERDGDYRTIWECYAPDDMAPATRWDNQYYVRQDFVGWSGLGPVALLLENIIGFQPVAPENTLYWNLRLPEPHGVYNYQFGTVRADIICEQNELPAGEAVILVESDQAFRLHVSTQVGKREFEVKQGTQRFQIRL